MSSPEPSSLHDFPDRSIRDQLSDPDNLRELIAALQPQLAARLDFAKLKPQPRDFLLEDWRGRECDLLFRLPYHDPQGDQPILICILLEHQSQPDPRMPLRVLLYMVLYWDREWREWERRAAPKEALRLTPVLPIVFHTGPREWTKHRTLAELLQAPTELQGYIPQWQTLFWDLAKQEPEELLHATSAWLKALAVLRVDREEEQRFRQVWEEVVHDLEGMQEAEKVRCYNLLNWLLVWVFHRRPEQEWQALVEFVRQTQGTLQVIPKGGTMITMAQRWYMDGEAKGRRQTLLLLGTKRFGTPDPVISNRLKAITDLAQLEELAQRLLDVNSWEELMAGPTFDSQKQESQP